MSLFKGDKGQIYTMEGLTASLIILGVLLFVIQANSLVVPQTEKIIDMKLGQTANDVLTSLDWNSVNIWSPVTSLKSYVVGWNGQDADYSNKMRDPGLATLDDSITSMLPNDVKYNLEFIYYIHYTNGSVVRRDDTVIENGEAGDNSMVSTRLVTINEDDIAASSYWGNIPDTFPQVVEVKIICWHL